jgi:hypothetical protein
LTAVHQNQDAPPRGAGDGQAAKSRTSATMPGATPTQRMAAGAAELRSEVVQRALFEHGGKILETTEHDIQGPDDGAYLHDMLADMCHAGAVDDILSLKRALLEDQESESDDTVEWVKDNDVGTMLEQIDAVLSALKEKADQEGSGEDSADEISIEEGKKGPGQKVGKLTFPGDEYHQVVKPAVIAAIGARKLSFLVYHDKFHTNFNLWFEADGSIFAEKNSTGNSKGKYTGYKWNGNAAVKDEG